MNTKTDFSDKKTINNCDKNISIKKSTLFWIICLPNMCAIAIVLIHFGFVDNNSKCLNKFYNPLPNPISIPNIGSKNKYNNSETVVRIITRDDWVAQPPSDVLNDLNLPVNRVIIAHTTTATCETHVQCIFRVRYIQQFHMESRNWNDIAYNFLVGGDGDVYEGRGWYKEGAHTKGFNKGSICIAFMGTFNKFEPENRQLQAAQLLIEKGVQEGHISKDYNIFGHRSFYLTESPGDALFNIIKTWPHFNETIGYDV